MKKPNWWDKPITWGASVTMSLLSIPITIVWILIMDAMTDNFGYIDLISEKVEDAKDWMSDLFNK